MAKNKARSASPLRKIVDEVVPGVTLTHLAREAGIDPNLMGKIAGGWRRITPDQARRVARVLSRYQRTARKVEPAELVGAE